MLGGDARWGSVREIARRPFYNWLLDFGLRKTSKAFLNIVWAAPTLEFLAASTGVIIVYSIYYVFTEIECKP